MNISGIAHRRPFIMHKANTRLQTPSLWQKLCHQRDICGVFFLKIGMWCLIYFCILNRIVQKPCKALIYRCVWRTMIEPIFQFKKKAKKDHIVKNWGLTNGHYVFGCFGCCQGLVRSISVEWIGTSAGLDKPSPSLVYTRGALITTPFHCVQLSPDYWRFVNCLQW